MLIERNELNKVIYENLLRYIIFEQNEITKTMELPSSFFDDKTQVSKQSGTGVVFIPHEKAKQTTVSVSPERKAWIVANADTIDPNVYVDSEGNIHSEVTDEERVFLVLHKADMIQSNIEDKMRARKKEEERLIQQRIEKIKADYAASGGDVESTMAL